MLIKGNKPLKVVENSFLNDLIKSSAVAWHTYHTANYISEVDQTVF